MDVTSVRRNIETLPSGAGSLAELERDLAALGAFGGGVAARWLARPAILRRVALALAERVPPSTSRIVASGDGALAIGTALSLTTGLALAAVEQSVPPRVVFGELHRGESVVCVAANATDLELASGALTTLGARVLQALCVVGTGPSAMFSGEAAPAPGSAA
jgi:hypothetical protein